MKYSETVTSYYETGNMFDYSLIKLSGQNLQGKSFNDILKNLFW